MLRCPLDRLVLQAKLLDMGEPKAIFGIALSQPDLENVERTVSSLKEASNYSKLVWQIKQVLVTVSYLRFGSKRG